MSWVVPVAGDFTDWISFQVALVGDRDLPLVPTAVTITCSAPSVVAAPDVSLPSHDQDMSPVPFAPRSLE